MCKLFHFTHCVSASKPAQFSVIRDKQPNSSFPLGKEKSGVYIQKVWLFGECPKGLMSVSPDFQRWWNWCVINAWGTPWKQKKGELLRWQRNCIPEDRQKGEQKTTSPWQETCKLLRLGNDVHRPRKELPQKSLEADWCRIFPVGTRFISIRRGGSFF